MSVYRLPGEHTPSFLQVLIATADRYVKRQASYAIELLRWPLFPLVQFVALYLTYVVTGREIVSGYPVAGFLMVGIIGMVLWTSNIWASGYAIEFERREGTLESLFLSPANRSAVVLGYGAGSTVVLVVPTVVVLIGITLVVGIRIDVASVPALVLSTAGILIASISSGYVLAGFFVLTRRANVIANFIQAPIYLLSGAFVPVSDLPGLLQVFARMFPLSYGMDAVRDSLLGGATVADVSTVLIGILVSSTALTLLGAMFIRKVERDARNGAELDFE